MEERLFSDTSYEQFLHQERLMGSRCKKCGTLFLPPRSMCAQCYAPEMDWIEMKGKGKLVAFTCIAIGLPFMKKEGYDRAHHYCSGVVELEEGVRIVARIEGVDTSKPEAIKIGTPLIVEFLHRSEGDKIRTFLAFRPERLASQRPV